ncbi:hypothetical protein [Geobacter sp.]|uniref:hypothetical protein n=1 Tax=Geobacter sp. TaxID=46610 RepID=UPI002615241A|nr:hypothetical protein [Geobacter sp.]
MLLRIVIVFLLALAPLAAVAGEEGRPAPAAQEPEALEKGKPVEKGIGVGEVHVYALTSGAGQSVTLQLEKRGVAAVATVVAPDGEKLGSFGSAASREGTERIAFVAERGGMYRITVRTFFKPSPPARYRLLLTDVHTATEREKGVLAVRQCEEKSWFDRDNNFLVNEALSSISRCMTAVGQRLEGSHPKASELAAEANAEVDYLIGRWHWGEFVSPAYQDNLVQDFRALAAAAGEADAKMAFSMMKGVAEDLKIKAEHCRKSNRGLGKDVDVYVKTYMGDREASGLIVYYKLGIHQYSRNRLRSVEFDELSSPAHTRLPASYYFIWTGRPGDPEPAPDRLKRIDVGAGEERKTTFIHYGR